MNFLITGSCGFIGYHLAYRLLLEGHVVIGIDSMTDYYDPQLKRARLTRLETYQNFIFLNSSIEDGDQLLPRLESYRPEIIIHLAAQAGIRYSAENPKAFVNANLQGSWQMLELTKSLEPKHLMLASSSSVYGANIHVPSRENDPTDQPLSVYAATKKGMEVMAYAYSSLHHIPTTVMRFFTVYGPWGRPDMAVFKFVSSIINDQPIEVFDEHIMKRDFTYVDDTVESVVRLMSIPPDGGGTSSTPYRVVNVGGGNPVALAEFIEIIEKLVGKKAIKLHRTRPPGDVNITFADTQLLNELTGYSPSTSLTEGVAAFLDWYRDYHLNRTH